MIRMGHKKAKPKKGTPLNSAKYKADSDCRARKTGEDWRFVTMSTVGSPSVGSPSKTTWVRGGAPPVAGVKFQTSRNKKGNASARVAVAGADEAAPRPSLSSLFSGPTPPPAAPPPLVVSVAVPERGTVDVSIEAGARVAQLVVAACGEAGVTVGDYDVALQGVVVGDTDTAIVTAAMAEQGVALVRRVQRRRTLTRLAQQQKQKQPAPRRKDEEHAASPLQERDGEADAVAPTADTVFLQVVLVDKTATLLRCNRGDTLANVKQRAIEAYLGRNPQGARAAVRYILRVPGTVGAEVDLSAPIGSIHYVQMTRSNSMTPSLKLEANPVVSRQAKVAEKELGALIGRPLCWTGGDGEVEMCRRVMRSVRRQEKNFLATKEVSSQLLGPLERAEFMVNVFLPLIMGGVKKTIKTSTQETGDELRERVFEKHYRGLVGPDVGPGDFVLKIVGFNDFVDGSEMMLEHAFLMKSVYMGQKPLLKMAERVPEPPEPDEDEWDEEEGDASVVETIRYDHDALTSHTLSWDQMTVFSIWDMQKMLRIKLLGVDSVHCRVDSKLAAQLREDGAESLEDSSLQFHLSVGVYHGGLLLRECLDSRAVRACTHPRLNHTLEFSSLRLSNLPRAARLCITLWSTRVGSSKVPVGWVNLQLSDYKHELRQGVISLPLWSDDEANPIGTCVPNSAPGMPILYLEMDSYALPVVFPTEPLRQQRHNDEPAAPPEGRPLPPDVAALAKKDSLYQLDAAERQIIWQNRAHLVGACTGLTKLILSVPYDDYHAVQEMHRILGAWPPLGPLDAMELLDARYADAHVRAYAVGRLELLTDAQLQDFLLQLVQVLKYEPYHDSALARFLVRRALRSSRTGHVLFWYLKGEMHVPEITERYGLLLEAYLRGVPNFRKELYKQNYMLGILEETAKAIKEKDVDMMETMAHGLMRLKFPEPMQLPLSPVFQVRSLSIPKCKYMDSKKKPLWLEFVNADLDAPGKDVKVIFKEGDDLRQDMLTLQMIRIMDRLWRNHGLDMQMRPYLCISTGDEVGFIEVVLNSATTAHITREAGGARGAFQEEPIANWIKKHNSTPSMWEKAQRNFMHSCAG